MNEIGQEELDTGSFHLATLYEQAKLICGVTVRILVTSVGAVCDTSRVEPFRVLGKFCLGGDGVYTRIHL